MTVPITDRRTRQRLSTSTYSSRTAALTSHVKVSSLIHARRRIALGFLAATSSSLKPAMPATKTEVSTTPLRRPFGGFGDNGQARRSTFAAVRLNRVRDLLF